MITATFLTDSEKHTVTLEIKGHAGADEKGKDTVCAGASMLSYTFAQYINDMYHKDRLKKRPELKLEEGDTYISAKVKHDDYAEAVHALFVIQVGFNLLAHKYKEYVQIKRLDEAKAS